MIYIAIYLTGLLAVIICSIIVKSIFGVKLFGIGYKIISFTLWPISLIVGLGVAIYFCVKEKFFEEEN